VKLGAIFLSGFVVAFGLRLLIEQQWVKTIDITQRPKRQFIMDGLLAVGVGAGVMVFNRFALQIPLVNGLVVVIGCAMAGFFVATDMALARERVAIMKAIDRTAMLPTPEKLYPMSRKFSMIALTAAVFVALVIGMVISNDIGWLRQIENDIDALADATFSVMYEVFFIMAVLLVWVVNLIVSYSKNLNLLFDNETSVLKRVSRGDFSRLVPVATNDEFGFIAGHTNQMIDSLKHRIELISALKMAEEVQQNLLPKSAPQHPGLEIDGVSIYCDQTGGDYFDYFRLPGHRLGVVVADAADHGVGAALHMATARAFLLYGIENYTGPDRLLETVNRHLTRDSVDTGRFTAAFFMEIDTDNRILSWIRAGHDPAWIYDSQLEQFDALTGKGIALGVEAEHRYTSTSREGWSPGSIIAIATDGLREARNAEGEMFGVSRFQNAVRANAHLSAGAIKAALISELETFQGGFPADDDVTLVVIKLF
jgi:sigma-B regulation protein RsbU (phosphoserine phosphatase)